MTIEQEANVSNNDTPTTSSSLLDQLESRLFTLEQSIGTTAASGTSSSPPPSFNNDIISRLDRLTLFASNTANNANNGNDPTLIKKRQALHQEFLAIDRLLSELSPLSISPLAGPTVAAAASAAGGSISSVGAMAIDSVLFRKMEVLASSEALKRDLDILTRIRDLVLLGSKETRLMNKDGSNVVNCPIVSSSRYDLPSDPEIQERLERLCFRVGSVHRRSLVASQRAEGMLDSYGEVMSALSEKIVLAEEEIASI